MLQGISSLPIELSEWPSVQAKQVAERFVGYLSQKDALPVSTYHKKPQPISEETKKELLKIFNKTVVEHLLNKNSPSEEFYIVGKGKHHTVWGHTKYSKIVFKLMAPEDADKQEKVACASREVTQQIEHCWVQIPRSTSFNVDQVSIYVEEKLPLALGYEAHQEFWARVIAHYQLSSATDSFRSNFENLIEQIDILIHKVGFWDVGYHNLPEVRVDGKGVCGTDFENIDLDLKQLPEGILRLANLVPIPPFLTSLAVKYEKQVPFLHEKALEIYEMEKEWEWIQEPKQETIMQKFHLIQAEKREALQALQTALAYYDEKKFISETENVPEAVDFTSLTLTEQILANYLIKKFRENIQESETKQCISVRRYATVQPGVSIGCPEAYTREGFLKVLEFLKDQTLVISWYDDFNYQAACRLNLSYVSYSIYF